MKKQLLYLLLTFSFVHVQAQFSDAFTDGNITVNPVWTGESTNWIVNSTNQLQSANTTANSTFYLSTVNSLATSVQWEFSLRLQFNTSSANYTDVFLTASTADLTATSTTGYFVRIGNTQDEIALYRKDGSTITKIIDGIDGITNTSDNTLRIKVTRSAAHLFTLYRDVSGTGNTYTAEGTATDATYTISTHFGILVKQSTSSFFQKHYFDDISVVPYTPDIIPPAVQNLTALSANALDILFSEPVEATSSQALANYSVNGIGAPSTASADASNPALVHLTFTTPFTIGAVYTLTINGVKDLSGNILTNGTGIFSFYIPQRFDVVIDEILADPTPVTGLPNAEYVELKNVSSRTINLKDWRISTLSSTSSAFPDYELAAGDYVVITSPSAVALFPSTVPVIGVGSFPALDNNGTTLSLLSKEKKTIHAVDYQLAWFANAIKEEGGWSLEMIDTQNPCIGANNWKGSTHLTGGTPGLKNSVDSEINDDSSPSLKYSYTTSADTLVLVFDEPLDSASAATVANYTLNSGNIVNAIAIAPLFNKIYLKLSAPLLAGTIYIIKASNVSDCKGNNIGSNNTVKAGIAEEASSNEVIINEILFNPKPNGEDYIELYNKSKKIINGKNLFIANRNSTSGIASQKRLIETPFNMYPGDYVILTENKQALGLQYHVKNPDAVLELSTLPSFPDDEGIVVILNQQGDVVDEVHYKDDWHFDLIANKEGVTLERIDPAGPSQNQHNWHSAASTAGYGTPSYQNSQWKLGVGTDTKISITPHIFSPDNDGYEDVATIQYSIEEQGYVANIIIFDVKGLQVRHLVKNGTLGRKGWWIWDGLNEQKQKLPVGTYIVYTELFNLQGKKERFKHTIVLARK